MAVAVMDSHVLLWSTLDQARLSRTAERWVGRMEREGGVASSISFWEIGIKVKEKKLSLPLTLSEYWSRLGRLGWLELRPVDAATWLANLELEWDHPDPADRTIVATARTLGLPLLSKDVVIQAFYEQTIW
jgi:PIN domain nuclease of toxin-antitoxin system